MYYKLIRNYYAPMCDDLPEGDVRASHGIIVQACNFNCAFCNLGLQPVDGFKSLTDDEFAMSIVDMIRDGKRFKFSGGEPTIDRTIARKMSFVRQCGGEIFLDTNGSRPEIVESMLANKLVDVLGISLKGVDAEQACRVSGKGEAQICWDNPIKTISLASRYPNVRFIITHVFFGEANDDELERFANLLPCIPNVRLKLNDLLFDKHRARNLSGVGSGRLHEMALKFIGKHPEWKSRVILVDSEDAIIHYSSIKFL